MSLRDGELDPRILDGFETRRNPAHRGYLVGCHMQIRRSEPPTRRITTTSLLAAHLPVSTVSRALSRAGLSLLSDLDPVEAIVRREHETPGDMLHIDTKKLGRIERPSHRVTGNWRDSVDGARLEMLFMAIDDHARSAVQFLRDTVADYAGLGVSARRLLADNGSAFRSKDFAADCKALGVRHRFTRPYRPQTNGKAGRLIQSALREWAYGFTYQHSSERTKALDRWNHHHNWHRPIKVSAAPCPCPDSTRQETTS